MINVSGTQWVPTVLRARPSVRSSAAAAARESWRGGVMILFDEAGNGLFPERMPELGHHQGRTASGPCLGAELRTAGPHRSARQLPVYARRIRRQLTSGVQKRRAEGTKPTILPE